MDNYKVVLALQSGTKCVVTPFFGFNEAWDWLLTEEAQHMGYVLAEIVGPDGAEEPK